MPHHVHLPLSFQTTDSKTSSKKQVNSFHSHLRPFALNIKWLKVVANMEVCNILK